MYFHSFGLLGGNVVSTTEIWDDGTCQFRTQVRGLYLHLDQTITPTGFSGTQGVDWDTIKSSRF